MGVLNVTPDSFSDGGRFLDPATAIEQASRMVAEGADILDIGAESTRPYGGAVAVSVEEEMRRLAPVLPAVVALGVPVSIDTMKAKVAAWALGVRRRDRQRRVGPAARRRSGARGRRARRAGRSSCTTATPPIPAIDIMADIAAFFSRSLDIAARAGIAREQHRARSRHRLRQDAGAEHHRDRAARRAQVVRPAAAARRLAQALHRQGFARPARPAPGRIDRRASPRGGGGAAIIRAHDVAETVQALRVAAAIRSAR